MLATILITCVVFGLAFVGLASGYLLRGRRLRGTCGGLAALADPSRENTEGDITCQLCTRPSRECTGQPTDETVADQTGTDGAVADGARPFLSGVPTVE